MSDYKHLAGRHNQATHGRKTARRRAYVAAFREARQSGASIGEARQKAKDAGLAKQAERDQRLARMRAARDGGTGEGAKPQPEAPTSAMRLKAEKEAIPKPPPKGQKVTITTPAGTQVYVQTASNGDTAYMINNGRIFEDRAKAERYVVNLERERIRQARPSVQREQERQKQRQDQIAEAQRMADTAVANTEDLKKKEKQERKKLYQLQEAAAANPDDPKARQRFERQSQRWRDSSDALRQSINDTETLQRRAQAIRNGETVPPLTRPIDRDGDGKVNEAERIKNQVAADKAAISRGDPLPKPKQEEDPDGLFGRDYEDRQKAVQARAAEMERRVKAKEQEREAFFAQQTRTSDTVTAPVVSRGAAIPPKPRADGDITDAPPRYREVSDAAKRPEHPMATWRERATDRQLSYAGDLLKRARANTKEGSIHRRVVDEALSVLRDMKKWETSGLIDGLQGQKPIHGLMMDAVQYVRKRRAAAKNDESDPVPLSNGAALLALPSFRQSIINYLLDEEAKAEGLPI